MPIIDYPYQQHYASLGARFTNAVRCVYPWDRGMTKTIEALGSIPIDQSLEIHSMKCVGVHVVTSADSDPESLTVAFTSGGLVIAPADGWCNARLGYILESGWEFGDNGCRFSAAF